MRQSPDLRTWRLRCVTPGRVVIGGNAIGASAWAHQRQNNFGNTILAGPGDRYPVFGQIRWCDPPLALENVSRCRHSMSGGLDSVVRSHGLVCFCAMHSKSLCQAEKASSAQTAQNKTTE